MMHSGVLGEKSQGTEASTLPTAFLGAARITLELSTPIMYCLS